MDSKHLFRRQFILSTNPSFVMKDWTNLTLVNKFYLSAHKDLEISCSSSKAIQLILIGFAVNPFEPLKSNQDIINDLALDVVGFDDLIQRTEPLGGRWVIMYGDGNSFKIFHDPCGQRQVYYHQNSSDCLVGSDPAIMSHFLKLDVDQDPYLQEFVNSSNFEISQKAWIGDGTIYRNVKHLLPNHYLNVLEKIPARFWPNKVLENIELEKGVALASEILTGSLKCLNHRHKLVLAVTGGWDSRVLLSATRDIQKDVTYFVSIEDTEMIQLQDVQIPTQLFKLLKIPFYVQKCSDELAPEFIKILKKNIMMARSDLPKTKFIYKYFLEFEGKISVNGNVCEIARSGILPIIPIKITGENLAKVECIDYGGLRYAEDQLDIWINQIKESCQEMKLSIYDMLYWEQRMGNWGAQYPAEQDISIEQFSPFNNRLLLTTLLSVDEKFRRYPDYILFYNIMEKLWPETLKVPLGMYGFKSNTLNNIKFYIRKLSGVY